MEICQSRCRQCPFHHKLYSNSDLDRGFSLGVSAPVGPLAVAAQRGISGLHSWGWRAAPSTQWVEAREEAAGGRSERLCPVPTGQSGPRASSADAEKTYPILLITHLILGQSHGNRYSCFFLNMNRAFVVNLELVMQITGLLRMEQNQSCSKCLVNNPVY